MLVPVGCLHSTETKQTQTTLTLLYYIFVIFTMFFYEIRLNLVVQDKVELPVYHHTTETFTTPQVIHSILLKYLWKVHLHVTIMSPS